ncbi:histidine triad nucleotide-binding protein 3-like isoform X2 [Zootermopsis nevadensis]|uniref:histidine triad nucleotide-binding protein 3-like isoform X2 n=1 Tax=Zootermopsis nevadensis TaxID=136037 RepID=UPI000B8E6E60|nr:histidine triad nucleotide-binding protein 3-like isoform X2 [Zootermopsis nevadensis]
MLQQNDNCVFCRICNGKEQSEILYKDDEYVVFPDIKPAAKHHYLIVTREHIQNAKQLTTEHRHVDNNSPDTSRSILVDEGTTNELHIKGTSLVHITRVGAYHRHSVFELYGDGQYVRHRWAVRKF